VSCSLFSIVRRRPRIRTFRVHFDRIQTLARCWESVKQHDHQVAHVQRLIQEANALESIDSRWHAQLARVRNAVGEHIPEEEEQIFSRIEQIWDATRREEAGRQIEQLRL
jgi:hemerythrin superfamily protein